MTTTANVTPSADSRITVLFMQTQTYFGADSQIHASIARHLDREHFRVIVACNRGDASGSAALEQFRAIPDVEVIPTDFGPSRADASGFRLAVEAIRRLPFIWGLARLARFARRSGVDIVHGTEKPRDVLYGYLIARACGAKVITQLHVKVEDWIKPMTRRIMSRDDGLIGVSRFVADSAVEMGYRADRVYSVMNALELDRWQPDVVDGAGVRSELGLPEGIPLVGIVARVFPWKGHETLIRALAIVRDRGLPFHLLIVGDDDPRATPDGGSYSSQLRELVSDLKLGPQVTFTGFRSDVPELMAALDVFAMPSFEEPFGMVYLESLAMRTPVVASRSGGVVEFIEDGVTGLLSHPEDVGELADDLARLIADPALRAQIGEAGREMVLSAYASPRMAHDTERVYRRILAAESRVIRRRARQNRDRPPSAAITPE